MTNINIDDLFDRRLEYPDLQARSRYGDLVGIDQFKIGLEKLLGLLINPKSLLDWQEKHHPDADNLVKYVLRRPPLVILGGDVGTGKTELGETVGDAVARRFDVPVTLFPMSLSTRGSGRVGEMTQLISAAFDHVYGEAKKLKKGSGVSGGFILLIDEADALAQSRENSQMHHEDRAGVNAFIRGVDRLAESGVPVAVIMCTNRLSALDPAIQRRACEVFQFTRPNAEQRHRLLSEALEGRRILSKEEVALLVEMTGKNAGRSYGFTYSDITQRLLPAIVLEAFPENHINMDSAMNTLKSLEPTPPFNEHNHGK